MRPVDNDIGAIRRFLPDPGKEDNARRGIIARKCLIHRDNGIPAIESRIVSNDLLSGRSKRKYYPAHKKK